MKRIEDIEMMEPEQLEETALKENIPVPEGLKESILSAIAANEAVRENTPAGRLQWAPYLAFAAAAALAAAVIIPQGREPRLRDTFEDPYLAYAQVEATFKKISDKMAVGVNMAAKAEETAEKPIQIIKNITE